MLYDLQKACIDRERPVYAVDLVEWFASWGRRPDQAFAALPRFRLHGQAPARRHAPPDRRPHRGADPSPSHHSADLNPRIRREQRLARAICVRSSARHWKGRPDAAQHRRGGGARQGGGGIDRPRRRTRLPRHGRPARRHRAQSPQAAGPDGSRQGDKKTRRQGDEKRRFFLLCLCWPRSLGRGIATFLLGDQLIRANRQLAADLDGVYHRGEIYLRWLQRFSAAAFGTAIGRLLTLYVALPFGCSLALLKVWDEVTGTFCKAMPEDSEARRSKAARQINPYAFTLLGLFFLALFHVPPFRRALVWAIVKSWHGLRWLFWRSARLVSAFALGGALLAKQAVACSFISSFSSRCRGPSCVRSDFTISDVDSSVSLACRRGGVRGEQSCC